MNNSMNSVQDRYTMNDGRTVPCVGFGTWKTPDGDETYASVMKAFEVGYRYVDTASYYGNEASVGKAVRNCGIPREELFVATKLYTEEPSEQTFVSEIMGSMERLALDYVDLLLIHWPYSQRLHPKDWKELNALEWQVMERMVEKGLVKSIGVSNFSPKYLEALLESAKILPVVNQIEHHPGIAQPETVTWCQEHHIVVQGWSPLGSGQVLADPVLGEIAAKYGKSPAQICLRWAVQKGALPLPKGITEEQLAENMQIFDFAITEEDMCAIAQFPPIGFSGMYIGKFM